MCVCLDEERLNGIVGGVEETCDAEQVGDVQLREEGAQVMQVGGQDGRLKAGGGGGSGKWVELIMHISEI